MKYFAIFVLLIVGLPFLASAHQPALVSPNDLSDYIEVTKPTISFAYYGELTGFPHTYEISTTEPITLYTQVLEPDIDSALKNHSGIIVREVERGVEEVARLAASSATWESTYEPFGGDRYLNGAEYEAEIEPGNYLIEVSNGDNLGKYVLVIGKTEDFSDTSIFATMARIYEVKRFFGKPAIAVFQSPFYYVPTFILLLIGGGVWYWRRRRTAKTYA